MRGTVHISAQAKSWDDTKAAMAVAVLTGGTDLVSGDRVTIYDMASGWAETRTWTSEGWCRPHPYISSETATKGSIIALVVDPMLQEVKRLFAAVEAMREENRAANQVVSEALASYRRRQFAAPVEWPL